VHTDYFVFQDTDWFESGTSARPDVTILSSHEVVSDVARVTTFDPLSHDTQLTPFDASTDDILMSFDETNPDDVSRSHNEVFLSVSTADGDSNNSLFERKETVNETVVQDTKNHQNELFDVSRSVADFCIPVDIPVPVFSCHASGHDELPSSRAGSEYCIPVDRPVYNDSEHVDLIEHVKKGDFEYCFPADVPCTFDSIDGQHVELPLNRANTNNTLPIDVPACNDNQLVDLLVNVNTVNSDYRIPIGSPVCKLDNIDRQLVELPLNRNGSDNCLPVDVPTCNDSQMDLLLNVNTSNSECHIPVDVPVCTVSNMDWQQVELPVNEDCSVSMYPNGDDDIVLIFDDSEQDGKHENVAHVDNLSLLASPTTDTLFDPLQVGMLNSSEIDRISNRSPRFTSQQNTNWADFSSQQTTIEHLSLLAQRDSEQLILPVQVHSEQLFVPELVPDQDSKMQLPLPVQHTADKPSLIPVQSGGEQLCSTVENQSQLLISSDITKEEYLPEKNEVICVCLSISLIACTMLSFFDCSITKCIRCLSLSWCFFNNLDCSLII